jgi:tetratricopeptide (TPR) repeat protein
MKSAADAFALFQRGDLAGAEAALRAALERAPEDTDALGVLGGVLHAKGDLAGAASILERAHALSPFDSQIAFNCAAVLSALGRHAECVEVATAFLKLRPGDPEALLLLGASLGALGRHEAALTSFDQTGLDRADVHARRAASLLRLGKTEDALTAAARACGLDPRNADAHYQRGVAFGALGIWREAAEALDEAIRLAPNNLAARAARAPALANLGRFAEGLADIEAALARTPDEPEYLARRAYILSAANRSEDALTAYDRVLTLRPADAASVYAKCDLLLGAGDFERGLPLYEIRHQLHRRVTPVSPAPLWRGDTPIAGKTILVQGEQGFGDLFQFSRFIPELATRGAKVLLQERPQTKGLMEGLSGVSDFVSSKEAAPGADAHIPLASLMLAFGTRIETIPATIPYLYADPARSELWRGALGPAQRRRIGVAWSGITRHAMQVWRSLDEAALAQLLGADADFVSLQMEKSAAAAARGVRQFGSGIADFAELAALIDTLDLVISIDTGVAHLAGALGKPVYLMLPFRADWRWLRGRADTPWYTNMRLFRQQGFGDWSTVIADVHAALQ